MKTKLLRKFRKRFQLVRYNNCIYLLDGQCIKVFGMIEKNSGGPYYSSFSHLIMAGMVSILGFSYFSLSEKRDYNRAVRVANRNKR